jgi:hypothetical protein
MRTVTLASWASTESWDRPLAFPARDCRRGGLATPLGLRAAAPFDDADADADDGDDADADDADADDGDGDDADGNDGASLSTTARKPPVGPLSGPHSTLSGEWVARAAAAAGRRTAVLGAVTGAATGACPPGLLPAAAGVTAGTSLSTASKGPASASAVPYAL